MSLNETVSAERVHISFFGLRNAGKSSLVNAVTGQKLAVVSPVKGTTTDPVKKAMELLPLGPVVIIDTPGFDDMGELGVLRVEKTNEVLSRTDVAVLVFDATVGLQENDRLLLEKIKARKLPYILAANKCDLLDPACHSEPVTDVTGVGIRPPLVGDTDCRDRRAHWSRNDSPQTSAARPCDAAALLPADAMPVSALTGEGIPALKERLAALGRSARQPKFILKDLVEPGDTVVLVIPIDESAPKGRIILPQQQTLRELLDLHCSALCTQAEELPGVLSSLKKPPRLVVTDSQAFERVAAVVPETVPLTSFSILFARYKGQLATLAAGARALSTLRDGDRVLISEGCTHHRQCNDIGTVKLPGWVRAYTGKSPEFAFTSGGEFPEDLSGYALVIHCGGCMLNEAAMQHRIRTARQAGVPIVNYGVAIAQMHGILQRSLAPFGSV